MEETISIDHFPASHLSWSQWHQHQGRRGSLGPEATEVSVDFPTLKGWLTEETRRRMARERRGAESSVVSMETLY